MICTSPGTQRLQVPVQANSTLEAEPCFPGCLACSLEQCPQGRHPGRPMTRCARPARLGRRSDELMWHTHSHAILHRLRTSPVQPALCAFCTVSSQRSLAAAGLSCHGCGAEDAQMAEMHVSSVPGVRQSQRRLGACRAGVTFMHGVVAGVLVLDEFELVLHGLGHVPARWAGPS
jgi:hypothetical protein